MSELYPMAGGLQRAAASSYCGLRGHMATPESLEEAKLIGRVVQGSTRNNGTSKVEDWNKDDGSHGPLVGDYGKVWIPITASGKGVSGDLAVGRMYVNEPTGPITWHWTDGPQANTPVWVGSSPSHAENCAVWCSDANNPGYGDNKCALNINKYCTGTAEGNHTAPEQADKCYSCYTSLKGGNGYEVSEPCMHYCGGMSGGHAKSGAWVPWATVDQLDISSSRFVRENYRCAYFSTFHQSTALDNIQHEFWWTTSECNTYPVVGVGGGTRWVLDDKSHQSGQYENLYTTVVEYEAGYLIPVNNAYDACGTRSLCSCGQQIWLQSIIGCSNIGLIEIPAFPDRLEGVAVETQLLVSLQGNRLVAVPDGHFDAMVQLHAINLDDNLLTRIPTIKNTHLQSLSLARNRITVVQPGELDGVPNLHELLLEGNLITMFDLGSNVILNLEELNMLQNPVQTVGSLASIAPPLDGNTNGAITTLFQWHSAPSLSTLATLAPSSPPPPLPPSLATAPHK
jgi:hypothetical protein